MEMSFSRRIANKAEPLGLTPDETRRRVLTVLFCTIGSLCSVLFGLINITTKPRTALVEVVLGALCLFLVPWVALRFKRSYAAHFLLLAMSSGLMAASLLKGGLSSSPAGWLALGPVMAVLLLGPRAALFWTGVFACLNPMLAYASAHSWDPASGPIAVYAGSRTGAVLMGYIVAALFEKARTRAHQRLERRRAETRLLLDHSDQGFASVHADGAVGLVYSSRLVDWLGPVPKSNDIGDWISSADPSMGDCVRLILEDIADDIFPIEVHLDQLSLKLKASGKTIGLAAKEVSEDRFLFVFTDLSESIALREVEAIQRQTHAIIGHMMTDSESFRLFSGETNRLFASIHDDLPDELLLRIVHIKGNCLSHDIREVAAVLHQVEEDFCPQERSRGERIRRTAGALGIPNSTREELEEAMFTDGVSTRDDVDVVSGRGVGTAAHRHEVVQLGGSIVVESENGVGTSFCLTLPRAGTASEVAHLAPVLHESPPRLVCL
ncbi:MAG: hypothetical protein AB8H86_16995 [Polyangiales bacterium]